MKKNSSKHGLSTVFTLRIIMIYLVCFLISTVCMVAAIFVLFRIGYRMDYSFIFIFVIFAMLISAIIGMTVSYFINKSWMKLMNTLKDCLTDVSNGNFNNKLPVLQENNVFYETFCSINKAIDELNSNAELKSDFISNFSHEFKTPIVSILGYAELLDEEPNLSREEFKTYLGIIIDESRRLTKLSKETMLMCNLDSAAIVPNQETYSLKTQLEECILLLDNEFKTKKINVILNTQDYYFHCNKNLLKEVWINLLSNSFKYCSEEGKIDISTYLDQEHIILSFRDNGIGMDEETKKHIFEKYYQADKTKPGIGLGLSISKRIVELFGGTIDVESVIGRGTIFNLTFPLSMIKEKPKED
jgi:signal transduction histidine kinase